MRHPARFNVGRGDEQSLVAINIKFYLETALAWLGGRFCRQKRRAGFVHPEMSATVFLVGHHLHHAGRTRWVKYQLDSGLASGASAWFAHLENRDT